MDPWITLRDEYYILQEELLQNDTPITRRNFIRSGCANVEGTLNYLMNVLAENASALTDIEKLAFQEKQISVKENGEVFTSPLLIKTKTKIKMVFKVLSRYPGADLPKLNDNDFNKLMSCFKKRDKLMHPRNDIDLKVSEQEAQDMIDGYRWYITNYQEIIKSIKEGKKQ